ncbi:MAG: endonuclease MutS2 [Campylobacterota bacterium]|nr:endonuclease MutS2 [Campylobacterota bacterium]
MNDIFKKLDLTDYIDSFSGLFSRKKPIVLEGDINLHYKLMQELDKHDLKAPQEVKNLDNSLMLLTKQGILKLDDIYEFVKILRYFNYLKRFTFEGKLAEWIDKIIQPYEISDIEMCFNDRGELRTGTDEDLDSIHEAIKTNKSMIKEALYKLVNTKKLNTYLVDRQVHYINGEETILVRGGFNHVLKAQVIHRSSAGFFYVLPHSVSQLKQKQQELSNLQEEILVKLCKQYSSVMTRHFKYLQFINKEFDRVDHYLARLFFAKINDKNFILPKKNAKEKLVDFIHPALSHAKPISVDFSKSVVMITGVNAGGKTMMLKSILSAILLSKHLVPYNAGEGTVIAHHKDVLAVLDDPQSVKNDISTFAGRMVEFSKLFSKSNIIVGVDEIELGTDSDEAASLFKVIIEQLIVKDIKIIITTHHKRLAALLASNEHVELIAALYDEENRKPTYEFLQGTIGKSYAFETASRYGIPLGVIRIAKEVYGDDKDKLNELIERSSELEREYQFKIQKLDTDIKEYERLTFRLKEQKEEFDDLLKNKQQSLEHEYKQVIDEAKLAIKTKDISQGHKHLNIAHKKLKEIKVDQVKEPLDLKVGDRVKYNNSKGVLSSIKGKKGHIELDDGMRMQVALSQLKRSGNPVVAKKQSKVKKSGVKVNVENKGSIKLDLHGMRGVEAVEKLDKFLSDALISGYDEVIVYHGIGTGKLAYAVKEFLLVHPSVVSFDDAPASQGGFGAKIIKL